MDTKPLSADTLYYGDNLDILRQHLPDESIDLIYLDPPFNSSRNYNVLFKEGKIDSTAQIHAFEDTWEWTPATVQLYYDLTRNNPNPSIAILIDSLAQFIGHNPMMAYLVNMTARLIPLHRILKSTGSLYLHCDPTASHYLKIILDTIFSPRGFRNEIIWRRYGVHNDVGQGSRHFGRVHDVLLFYTKGDLPTWNQVFTPLDPKYVETTYRHVELETGRKFTTTPLTGPGGEAKGNPVFEWKGHTRAWRYSRETMEQLDREGRLYYSRTGYVRQKLYLDKSKGVPVQDEWDDIPSLSGAHAERLGYPTQKPEALLERIIAASSNEGGWVLDPFCGCGTSIAVAQRLNRHWIGIDISMQAIKVIKLRLQHHYPGIQIPTDGIPKDYESACALSEKDKMQFQDWAISLINAYAPSGVTKKGADRGVDGFILFYDRVDYQKAEQKQRKIVVQVKGGVRERRDIATLKGDMEREKAPMGVFITLLDPTPEMKREAALAGDYAYSETKIFPKVQILSMKEWFSGKRVQLPSSTINPFKMAEVKSDQKLLFPGDVA